MKTLNELVAEVSKGVKRVDARVMVDRLYDAKCYWVGTTVIRIDLIPVTPQTLMQAKKVVAVGGL